MPQFLRAVDYIWESMLWKEVFQNNEKKNKGKIFSRMFFNSFYVGNELYNSFII